jgi:diguanylate cyclase (GGDEF)-like protein/putative nucleotidyltransferase with HDIG domain
MGAITPPSAPVRTLVEAQREQRETGGVTTRLILDYVERERGREAVERLLASCGLSEREEQLRDEHSWSSFETKIAMLDGAAQVLDDPLAARHVGQAAMDFNIAPGLKLSLRALGSVRLLYRNIARTCSKFSTAHRMDAVEVGSHHARIAYTDVSGKGYHPADCELNIGLLACAAAVFGLPLARVSHPVCARDGGGVCVYDVRWERGASRLRKLIGAGTAAVGAVAAAIVAGPEALPAAAAVAAAAGAYAGGCELSLWRRRFEDLQTRADAQAAVAERLTTSLHDLVSELRLDDVLAKIVKHAQAAVGGKEFVLLVDDGEGMRCRGSSILPHDSIEALERWAGDGTLREWRGVVVDDLADVPSLAALTSDRALPLRSLCSAPLVYRGEPLGLLVALAPGASGFLPNDVDLLQSYAAQASIALANARLYEAQEQLASRDPLTGLLNHREFHEAVGRELEACRRHGGSMSVVLVDLDGFKRVNDTSGHSAGDRVLLAVAEGLRDACRISDQAFRVGGDEFALLLPRTTGREAITVAERAAAAATGAGGRVGASYGIAEWPADGPSKDSLLARADEKLYAMKRSASGVGRALADPAAGDGERQRERLACANRLSARLAPLLDSGEIAAITVEEVFSSFAFHGVAVHQLGEDRVLRPVAGAGPLTHEMSGWDDWEQPIDVGVAGRAARTGEPVLVLDTALDPDYIAADAPATGSELDVPIRVRGEVWGVFNLEQRETHAFDADDVVFADLIAAHVGAALDRTRLTGELEGTFMATLGALCDALENKDAYTAEHAREVEDLSERVARRLGLPAGEVRTIRYAALLHDIGKIGIPTEILNKPGPLTDAEFAQIKQHTIIGARILERIPFFEDVHPLVRSAHERWDGRGYPDALAAGEIPLGARVICACDAFHAMTSDRPYCKARPKAEALEEMRRHAGRQFDPAVVDALWLEATAPATP